MSREERWDTRDRTFSHWHRRHLPAFVTAIDIDFLEYCGACRETLALIELARDVGQAFKPTPVLQKLAARADVPAYLIFYMTEGDEVIRARVQRLVPRGKKACEFTGDELAEWLTQMHLRPCPRCGHQPL